MSNVLGFLSTDLEESYEGELDLENLDEWYQQKIDEAVRLLIRKAPNIVARMAAYDPVTGTGLDPEFVKDKVVGAVLRVLRDPEGISEETEGNYSYRRNPVVASANIWYTKDELADLGISAAADKPRTVWASTRYGWP
jgi:hypothetical protein